MAMNKEITLEGSTVSLIPLDITYKESLFEALQSPEVWKYTWREVNTVDDLEQLLITAVESKKEGKQIPFIIMDKVTGQVVGTTRIGDIDRVNRNVEIGWTWLSPEVWRTKVNTECKFLLLKYCFEDLKVIRVQFSVSGQNLRSQKAVERIGATKEGTFRKHRVKADGSIHDNIFYSIIDSEWDSVKQRLIDLLAKEY
ncbi:RimJ/RimL family protein N-acetyltransferase [Pullulanibacillus pueri]|uniref:N-acetyltransferase n=1 Tax=Pullulanibacillus pueri TaxID=1437324 RepID=A0A8J2ZYI3_9BACL|nr:GNAT family protein [Pullulanibacillus pueri]MBM7683352.1 RimJ/RimL family protein N-acetyltransferase [Pullulanibacillus pueri]GGH86623.1 N-acetyltransferase [Pullulanibacillus pueri]